MKRKFKVLPAFEANYKAKHLVARLKLVVYGSRWYNNKHFKFRNVKSFYTGLKIFMNKP